VISSLVTMLDAEQKSTDARMFFKDGQMMSPEQAKYPAVL